VCKFNQLSGSASEIHSAFGPGEKLWVSGSLRNLNRIGAKSLLKHTLLCFSPILQFNESETQDRLAHVVSGCR
jgi:hypothetical protein